MTTNVSQPPCLLPGQCGKKNLLLVPLVYGLVEVPAPCWSTAVVLDERPGEVSAFSVMKHSSVLETIIYTKQWSAVSFMAKIFHFSLQSLGHFYLTSRVRNRAKGQLFLPVS